MSGIRPDWEVLTTLGADRPGKSADTWARRRPGGEPTSSWVVASPLPRLRVEFLLVRLPRWGSRGATSSSAVRLSVLALGLGDCGWDIAALGRKQMLAILLFSIFNFLKQSY